MLRICDLEDAHFEPGTQGIIELGGVESSNAAQLRERHSGNSKQLLVLCVSVENGVQAIAVGGVDKPLRVVHRVGNRDMSHQECACGCDLG